MKPVTTLLVRDSPRSDDDGDGVVAAVGDVERAPVTAQRERVRLAAKRQCRIGTDRYGSVTRNVSVSITLIVSELALATNKVRPSALSARPDG